MKFGKIAVVLICLVFCALVICCDQEPLFWDVANEYPPIEPLIKGHPSKIVSVETSPSPLSHTLYVGNGNAVWVYDTATDPSLPVWNRLEPPAPGKILDLAAVGNILYALDDKGKIKKFDGTSWSDFPLVHAGKMECIFGDGSYLFAGALTGTAGSTRGYAIFVIDNTGTIAGSKENTGKLMGVALAGGTYYLGTLGDGVYSSNGGNPAPFGGFEMYIAGLTADGGDVYVVTSISSRKVQKLSGGVVVDIPNTRYSYSGAIAVWEQGLTKLLLVGIQYSSSTYGYGYREINIGVPTPAGLEIPGEYEPTSVKTDSQYISAISKNLVNFLYIVPDSVTPLKADADNRPIIFAGTIKDGLWSYRSRKGNAQWNGEDRTSF